MKKALITGSSGFIGNKIALHLLGCGYEVIGWDVSESRSEFMTESIDMEDSELVRDRLGKVRPDVVIHCAGSADVGKSFIDPVSDYRSNVTVTHNLLFGMHDQGMTDVRVIFISSAAVYGEINGLPIREDMLSNPISPYALHKSICENMCGYFISNYGFDIKIARVFSAYGAGLKKQIFWDMYWKWRNTGALEMYGTGSESRDYIHVDDVVRALFLLITHNTEECIFNVANGNEITIRSAVNEFAKAAQISQDKISFDGTVKEGNPRNWVADIRKISRLGYKRSVPFEKGVEDYVRWVEGFEQARGNSV